MNNWCICFVFHAYVKEMDGSRSKIPSKKSHPYTHISRLSVNKIFIRKEVKISGIQAVRSKHKRNWINYLERIENTRLPKHALNYKPRGRRDGGRPRKRW